MNILFDLSILIHSNYHITQKFASDKITSAGLFRKTKQQINKIIRDLKKTEKIKSVILCADSCNFRKDIYPQYKEQRKGKHTPEFFEMKDGVVTLMEQEFDVRREEGLEGDDLLFLLSRKYSPSIIITNDKDMVLMVDEKTRVYRPRYKEWFDINTCEPELAAFTKMLLGDKGDNIPRTVINKSIRKAKIYTAFDDAYNFMCQCCSFEDYDDEDRISILFNHSQKYGIELDFKAFHLNFALACYSMETYKKYVKDFDKIYNNL